jgi:glycosyltransferase involved in cell wall biosynthesis
MRVAVVHNLPPGGARRRLINQLRTIDAKVVAEVCLSTATPVTSDAHIVALHRVSPSLPRAARPPFRYLDHLALRSAWHRAANIILASQADVVFMNPCQFLQAPPISRRDMPPIVYYCDEPRRVDSEPAASGRSPFTRPIYKPLYRAEQRCDRSAVAAVMSIATNSRYTAGEIKREYGRTAQIVPLGVQPLTTPAADQARGEFVLTVGTLIPTKGHDLVIEAAALSHRPVTIVAPRPSPMEEGRLRALAQARRVSLEIFVSISDEALGQLYETAFATVYMARREPLGLVSLEAQMHGCPVVVADEGGLPETVHHGETGFCCPRQPEAITSALRMRKCPARRGCTRGSSAGPHRAHR